MSEFNFTEILNSLYRRKWLVAAAFLIVSLISAYLAVILPSVYQSSTLILISPQRVPSSFVASTITMNLAERMQGIIQEILSRTQLEKIITEFDLRSPDIHGVSLEDRVESLRKKIRIEFPRYNVFKLSFESTNPEKTKQVTSRIASLFIEQNLQDREQQVIGTKSFVNAEADRLRKDLEEQEAVVNQYKSSHLYEMPEQLNTNLRTLEQLQREQESIAQRMTALQERKGVLQKQAVESDILGLDILGGLPGTLADGGTQNLQIGMKKKELEGLLQRYSGKHPDVARLRKEIELLERESLATTSASAKTPISQSSANPLKQVLESQIADIESEVHALRAQMERVRSQIGLIKERVDNTPLRAIELSKISRGYDITLRKFQDLLAKGLESEVSENLEKKQKGEQFEIIDPANIPLKPVRPNRLVIVMAGLVFGLGGGVGLALLLDTLDRSFKHADEIQAFVNVPLLATLPALMTRGTIVEQRRGQGLLVLASVGALGVGLVLVRLLGPVYF
jgi:polysaccharide chain length determinant protein (PEP-CTERM system associated)